MMHSSFRKKELIVERPFRTVHNSCSDVSLLGGGTHFPQPGEISLAHKGVLFLDELCEFSKRTIQMLRISLNPCSCGYYGDDQKPCLCTPSAVQKYFSRISGPFLDRIHMILSIDRLKGEDLFKKSTLSTSVLRAQLEESKKYLRKYPGYFSQKNILQVTETTGFV